MVPSAARAARDTPRTRVAEAEALLVVEEAATGSLEAAATPETGTSSTST